MKHQASYSIVINIIINRLQLHNASSHSATKSIFQTLTAAIEQFYYLIILKSDRVC